MEKPASMTGGLKIESCETNITIYRFLQKRRKCKKVKRSEIDSYLSSNSNWTLKLAVNDNSYGQFIFIPLRAKRTCVASKEV